MNNGGRGRDFSGDYLSAGLGQLFNLRDAAKSGSNFIMPALVILLSLTSIALLMWVTFIGESISNYDDLSDAIMDIQYYITLSHLNMDNSLIAGSKDASDESLAPARQAMDMLNVILRGGKTGRFDFSFTRKDSRINATGQEVRTQLLEFIAFISEHLEHPDKYPSILNDPSYQELYRRLILRTREWSDLSEKDIVGNRRRSRHLFFGILAVWSSVMIVTAVALLIYEIRRKKTNAALVLANERLSNLAQELASHREKLEEMIEDRTGDLLAANKHLVDEIADRKRAEEFLKASEKQVRRISFNLLKAQEMERKRVAMELHDELGQSLIALKLKMWEFRKGLKESAPGIDDICQKVMANTDRIIDDVRNISMALSPTVIEKFGLNASIEWLVGTMTGNSGVTVNMEIEDLDAYLSDDDRIAVYRVIQEALTNVIKHAKAKNATLIAKRVEDTLLFLIEDDGRGASLNQINGNGSPGKGFGHTTMIERVKMMKGELNVESLEGKGSRVSFTIPITQKENSNEQV